jgi:quercetin dioxygenase-like cupin family protein
MDGPLLHEWKSIEEKTIFPGFRGRFIHSANMSFALWDVDAGASLPEHAHPHEQVGHLLEGEFSLTIASSLRHENRERRGNTIKRSALRECRHRMPYFGSLLSAA